MSDTNEPGLSPNALDELSDADAAQLAGQIQIPVQTLVLAGANLQVVRDPKSEERAIMVGPIALNVVLPLTKEAAHAVSRELTGGIEIASGLPPQLVR
jgi:hypothetical protein